MILGVSHLALCSPDLEGDKRRLEARGWTTVFVDHDVLVQSCERAFLSADHPGRQSLVLLRHPRGYPAVELVSPTSSSADNEQRSVLNLFTESYETLTGTIRVPDLEECAAFFVDGLGFESGQHFLGGGVEVVLRRPLSQWSIALTLEKEAVESPVPTLDGGGWFVLALLSSDLGADAAKIARHGLKAVTDPFTIRVGGRRWSIVLCVLKSGFAIELMQPASDDA